MKLAEASLLALISFYRFGISPVLPGSCRFQPTCSAYARDAVRRFGAVTGSALALRRLARCHPWGGWGYDPVPDDLEPSGAGGEPDRAAATLHLHLQPRTHDACRPRRFRQVRSG